VVGARTDTMCAGQTLAPKAASDSNPELPG